MSKSFVHLHNHTEYSMLDGAARLGDLFSHASKLKMPGLAMTDHGNMYGAYKFYDAAKEHGINPIIGMEAYLAPGSRFEIRKSTNAADKKGDRYSHMTLLAMDNEGYQNLSQISSLASLEGYYFHPRADRELLERYNRGLVATSGCVGGEIAQKIYHGKYEEAKAIAGEFSEIFGKGNFFIEIMRHNIDIEKDTQAGLLRLAKELNLPLLATNDLHYVKKEDAKSHDALLCIQTKANISDTDRFKFESEEFYLKSAEEMWELFSDVPEACENTLLINERANVVLERGKQLLPQFPVPEGHTQESYLRERVDLGLKRRYDNNPPEKVLKQAEYELGVINQMGFPAYFTIVEDLVDHAHKVGIRVGPGRGSAPGCLVAYALRITDIDPIEHGLFFERFLNPDRISMPDIDMDFDERRRSEMIKYSTDTYGEDHVAQIVTYGSIKAKAALKDSARVLGLPYVVGEKLTKAFPPGVMGKEMELAHCFDKTNKRYSEAKEIRDLYETDPQSREVIDLALGLEGLKRQVGVHAAGVIISGDPLSKHVPVWRRPDDGAIITQFDGPTCEDIGLLKMDFLGLRNLTILDDALDNIKRNRGIDLVLEDLGLDDPATYKLLQAGDTTGVFQLESTPMRALMRSLAPESFNDISALIALYRPGPMGMGSHTEYAERKNGRKPIVAIHPELEAPLKEVLGETYGLCVAGDTRIWDASSNTLVRMDSIEKAVEDGFFTYSVSPEGNLEKKRVSKWAKTGFKKIYEIKTMDGRTLRVSGEHPVMTPDGYKKAQHLKSENLLSVKSSEAVSEASYVTLSSNAFNAKQKWVAIKEIMVVAEEDVYDVTVEDNHNFYAENILVHNCVFQEQVMAAAQQIAGYTLGEADLLRRAMGKKKKSELDKQYEKFQSGMRENGYSDEAVKALWNTLEPFADYAFNKSHSAAYGVISYWTAYLKANYPAEYMAALLTSVGDDKDKSALYLNECRRMGITVLSPDVNESEATFTAVGNDIRFGLEAIRGVGSAPVAEIVETRKKKGRFDSFHDYAKKAPSAACSKKVVEGLIKAGGFDAMGHKRFGLHLVFEDIVSLSSGIKKQEAVGQFDLFSTAGIEQEDDVEIPDREWDQKTLLGFERETLGLYVSAHPLDDVDLSHESPMPIAFLSDETIVDREEVKIAGLVVSAEHRVSKQGKPWASIVLEDKDGSVEVVFFGKSYLNSRELLKNDEIIVVAGLVDKSRLSPKEDGAPARDEGVKIIGNGVRPPGVAHPTQLNREKLSDYSRMTIILNSDETPPATVQAISKVLQDHPGELTVSIKVPSGREFHPPFKFDAKQASRLQLRSLPMVTDLLFE